MAEYKLDKYTIEYDDSTELITSILRKGQPWKDIKDVAGDNVLNMLLWRVLELEQQLLDTELGTNK